MKLEDSRQFEIGGNTDAGSADISITCLRCPDWHHWIKVSTDDGPAVLLADLNERAEEHIAAAHQARFAAEPKETP